MIYDISPPISESLAVWPGDTPPTREILAEIGRGDRSTLSTLHTTVHLGAHVDAPNHIGPDAPSIAQCPLDHYLGECQIVNIEVSPGALIDPRCLAVPIQAPRVIFATGTYPDSEYFNEDFAALSPELVNHLAEQNVILVGIDTPSIDLFTLKDLPAHKAALRHNMAILEGLVLKGVPEGLYELIALPLRLAGFDASPVRAILRTLT